MAFKRLIEDIDAYLSRDPAARSRLEVALCYPGFHGTLTYRLTHGLWRRGWRLSARFLAYMAKAFTGIDIHPGARIGRRFVIDHGTGVVIGETADIGDDVTIYQGVTLGGIAPAVDSVRQVNAKRHPTLDDGVIVGSGAQILGPVTVGAGARIGANSVVTKDVPKGVTAVGIPARVLIPRDKEAAKQFVAYGTPAEPGPDPIVQALDNMRAKIAALESRLEEVEGRVGAASDSTPSGATPFADRGRGR